MEMIEWGVYLEVVIVKLRSVVEPSSNGQVSGLSIRNSGLKHVAFVFGSFGTGGSVLCGYSVDHVHQHDAVQEH